MIDTENVTCDTCTAPSEFVFDASDEVSRGWPRVDIELNPFKGDFPLLAQHPELAFLDSGATAQRPACVLEAQKSFYETMNANPLRGLYSLSVEATEAIAKVRSQIAELIGAVDERGRVVDGDQILYVCGVYLNKHGRLSGGTVVPTIASNFGLIKSLELAGLSAVTSGVGDRHVYAKMREGGYSLGGEQTGHTIFGDIERTGDGIMTSLRVMEVIRAERETLSQLTAPCKLLPQAQVAVRVTDKDAALDNMGVQAAIAEAEAALAGEGRVLVRKSGTESVIRVLAEAPDQPAADAAMKRIAAALEAL